MEGKRGIDVPWSGVGSLYTEEEIALVGKVMRETTTTHTQGRYLREFEQAFARYNGNENVFAVSSCTAALELVATLEDIGEGDEVIIPSHTFCATAIPFAKRGATIVWADIDPCTWVVTDQTIEKCLSDRTKAVVVVHLYGLAAAMAPLIELSKQNNFIVVEDCAQAIGAEFCGKKVGTFGDYGCFSFHTHKNITTLGEGGILTVKDRNKAGWVPGTRHNGVRAYADPRDRYWVPAMSDVDFDVDGIWPHNFCIGEVQCAVGAMLLERIDDLIAKRTERALRFKSELADYPELTFQDIPYDQTTNYHLLPAKYTSQVEGKSDNNDFIEIMSKKFDVKVIVQYYPLNRYPMFQRAGFQHAECPVTDELFDNMVSFPFHSWMSDEEFEHMLYATKQTVDILRDDE